MRAVRPAVWAPVRVRVPQGGQVSTIEKLTLADVRAAVEKLKEVEARPPDPIYVHPNSLAAAYKLGSPQEREQIRAMIQKSSPTVPWWADW